MMSMCSALLLAGCNKTSQQDQTVSKEQKSTAQKATEKRDSSCTNYGSHARLIKTVK
jgi:outer membrane biogenesis lipoprotein LolB